MDLVLSHYHNYRPQYKLGGIGSVNGEAICGSPSNSTFPNPGHWNAMQNQNTYSASAADTGATADNPGNVGCRASDSFTSSSQQHGRLRLKYTPKGTISTTINDDNKIAAKPPTIGVMWIVRFI